MTIYLLTRKDSGETAYYSDRKIAELDQSKYREHMGVECEITDAILDERGTPPFPVQEAYDTGYKAGYRNGSYDGD